MAERIGKTEKNGRAAERRFVIAAAALLLSFGFNYCANQLGPPGGEIDTTPPAVVNVYPPHGTLNYDDDYFEVEFTEYINKRNLREAIFISPYIDGSLDISYGGDDITVYFPGPLRDDVTYNITIGTDITDYNNNNPLATPVSFSFSTGDKLDNGSISGKVYAEEPAGIMLLAYRLDTDSTLPSQRKPDYLSQAGKDGTFIMIGLAKGEYNVYAVKDEFSDLIYQPTQDMIGIPSGKITITESDTLYSNQNYFMMKSDSVPPEMTDAVMTDGHHMMVTFSEDVAQKSIAPGNFTMYDSTQSRKINIDYAYKGSGGEGEMFLAFADSVGEEDVVVLFSDNIIDADSNLAERDTAWVVVSTKVDTIPPRIDRVEPKERENLSLFNPEFTFLFSEAFNTEEVMSGVTVVDTLNRQPAFETEKLDDASFKVKFTEKLRSKMSYQIVIPYFKMQDVMGNMRDDSILTHTFTTINEINYTGVVGTLKNYDSTRNIVLMLDNKDKEDLFYKGNVDPNGKFEFKKVEPGKYELWAYYDDDSSGTYTYGSLVPLRYSEQFSYLPGELKIPPRWAITDVIFYFVPKEEKKKESENETEEKTVEE